MSIPILGSCNCSMFCCVLLYVHSNFCNYLHGEAWRQLVALLSLSSWCLVIVALPRGAMRLSAACDCGDS